MAEDAFPQQDPASKKRPTCWEKEKPPQQQITVPQQIIELPREKEVIHHYLPAAPQTNGKDLCLNSLHHCFSCKSCKKLLLLHLQNERPQAFGAQVSIIRNQPVLSENQVGKMIKRPQITRRRMTSAAMGTSVLSQPVAGNSGLTWGHLLLILAGGAFLLLIYERLRGVRK